jgi:hypothetical protein
MIKRIEKIVLIVRPPITCLFEPAVRIRQPLRQIEPLLGVPEQVIGSMLEREFEIRK